MSGELRRCFELGAGFCTHTLKRRPELPLRPVDVDSENPVKRDRYSRKSSWLRQGLLWMHWSRVGSMMFGRQGV